MHLSAKEKNAIFKKFGGDAKNTGSTEGQIALFSNRISHLTDHLKNNRKDKNTQRSLQIMVGKRRGLLDKFIMAYTKKDLFLNLVVLGSPT